MQKGRVNWSLDSEVIEGVKQKAKQITSETGVQVSVSAAANALLKQALTPLPMPTTTAQDRPATPKFAMTKAAPKPGAQPIRREDVEE